MSGRYDNDPLADINTQPEVLEALRRRLNAIKYSTDTPAGISASERAQSVVEALEALKELHRFFALITAALNSHRIDVVSALSRV